MGVSASLGRLGSWPLWVVAAALCGLVGSANATYISNDERIEAQAELSVQNTFQHDNTNSIEWVQERNEVKLGLRYFLVPVEQDLLGFLHRPRVSIQYRGRYDAVFDIREKYDKLGFRDKDDFRFPEGEYPRELYFDAELAGPLSWLSFRIGRQQVVWGEADLFRSLDVINPLRLDQNGLIGERFDDYREPLLIAKFLAALGPLPGLSNATLEFFYSPNSQPLTNKVIVGEGFRLPVSDSACLTASPFTLPLPPEGTVEGPNRNFKCLRPVAKPFRLVRHPWEVSRVGPYRTDAPNFADVGAEPGCLDGVGLQGGCGDFVYGINDGWPRKWISMESSMVGARLFGQTWGGIDIGFNYIYKRTEVPGTSLTVSDIFADEGQLMPNGLPDPLGSGDGAPNPRTDRLLEAAAALATVDGDGNGFPDGVDAQVADCIKKPNGQVIFASVHGETPYSGSGIADVIDNNGHFVNAFTGCEKTGFWYPWTHIIGLTATYNDNDYTGFIWRLEQSYSTKEPRNHTPPLAAERRGQFPLSEDFEDHLKRDTGVWRSMIGFDYLRSITSQSKLPAGLRKISLLRSLLTDQWFFTFQFFNEYYTHSGNQIGLLDSVTDRMYSWNPVLTYVMTGFFMNNRLRPFIAAGYDVNVNFPVTWVQFEWFITPQLSLKVGDIEYLGSKNAESFLFLHKYADRDTFFAKLTYFIL